MTHDASTRPNKLHESDSIATTGPGIPDDALSPGEELLTPPTDEEVEAMARKLGAPIHQPADAD